MNSFPGRWLLPLYTSLLLLAVPVHLNAQMFSVEERSPYDREVYRSSLGLGWEIGDFSYRGDPQAAGNDRYDFTMGILRMHFENPGVNMYFGIAGKLTGSDNQNYLNLGVVLYNDFMLTRPSSPDRPHLFVPLQLNTDLMRTNQELSSREFQQTTFQLGTGLGLNNRFHERLRATFRLVPGIGFTNSQGAFIGGSIYSVEGKARFHIVNLLGNRSLLVGYDYRFRRYNIDLEIFNYDLASHTISIGFAL